MNVKLAILLAVSLPVLGLLGCSSVGLDKVLPDKQVEYKREVVVDKQLEVPPDLTSSRIDTRIPGLMSADGTTYSEYATGKKAARGLRGYRVNSSVLPEFQDISLVREGRDHWLVVAAPADQVWDRLVDFWQNNGILLTIQDPELGVMETDWLENRADIKSDAISNLVRNLFEGAYDAGTRDRYRIRLEKGERPGTTEVYLVHFGMEQDFATAANGEDEQIFWKIRPRDPGLEVIMLRRLMVYLGLTEEQARASLAAARELQGVQSRILKEGSVVALDVDEPFSKSWRLVGLALDRVGFLVEDRNRSEGVYFVRYNDPSRGSKKGWLSKLAFWNSDSDVQQDTVYQVRMEPESEGTRVRIHDQQGNVLNDDTALRILTLIKEKLK